MIPPCPRCGGHLMLDIDGVYLEREYICGGCARRYDRRFNLLHGEISMDKFLEKHGLLRGQKMAFTKSKRYRVRS